MEDVADQDEAKKPISREELIKIVQCDPLKFFRSLI